MAVRRDHDERFAKWIRWLDRIKDQINNMVSYRFMYQSVRDIIQANPELPASHFLLAFSGMYADSLAAAVRRQAERVEGVVSVGRLLQEITETPEIVSRERHMAAWMGDRSGEQHELSAWGQEAASAWEKLAGDKDALNAGTETKRRLDSLLAACEKVKTYTDKHVAHLDKATVEKPPTFAELHAAIDAIYETYEWLLALLEYTSRASEVPIFQYDWYELFRHPWLTPEVEERLKPFPDPRFPEDDRKAREPHRRGRLGDGSERTEAE